MNRTATRTSGLVAAAAALAVSGYAAAGAGQAVTPAHTSSMGSMAHHATVYRSTGPVIRIANFTFHAPLSVRKGALVTVRNTDGTTHTVTSNRGLFTVRVPANSKRTFRAPGRVGNFGFHCKIHASMTGTLRVR